MPNKKGAQPRKVEEPDLPSTLERSDEHAQAIFRETLKSARETYGGDDNRAYQTAWASVKHQYEKEGDRWVKKDDADDGKDD
ncbi:MAG: ChaB family protein [Anaerolineae bacterium]|nr:ChaB family protein [Anaerolineae bacterium]